MKQSEFDNEAPPAVRAGELIENILQLDKLINLHQEHLANKHETQQYLDKRQAFVDELNNLLQPHQLRLIREDRAA